MHIFLYLFAVAAVLGAIGLSVPDLDPNLAPGVAAVASGLREHGLLLVGGLILLGLGRILQSMKDIAAGLRRVADAAEEATRLE